MSKRTNKVTFMLNDKELEELNALKDLINGDLNDLNLSDVIRRCIKLVYLAESKKVDKD